MEPEIPPHGDGQGYELRDAPVRSIVLSALGLAVGTVIVCVAMAGLFRYFAATEEPGTRNPMAPAQQIPPEPRVEVKPWEQLKQLRAREDQVLSSYGWVEKEKGVARIPIDRAMELTLERGLPVRKEGK